ncbi:hypothetical protein Tco_1108739 [Tanacetum coccineum]
MVDGTAMCLFFECWTGLQDMDMLISNHSRFGTLVDVKAISPLHCVRIQRTWAQQTDSETYSASAVDSAVTVLFSLEDQSNQLFA